MARRLSAVAAQVNGRLVGDDANFGVVCTDSRTLSEGSLFVAIRGENFDGNDYVAAAAARGAVGAMVSVLQDVALPQIEVDDTRRAFSDMARAWRENFEIPVVAVTGSAGKTTVKELIAAILSERFEVCVTEGNLNNDIGVPLSLMRLGAADEAMVVELGANHAGEIRSLGALVEPSIGVITNAGAAHLEGFGSVAGVARAKGELIDCLPGDGVAVLNADDKYFEDWCRRAGSRRVVSFGFSEAADYRLLGESTIAQGRQQFSVARPNGSALDVELRLLGRVNIANALAAIAAADVVGASAAEITAGLAKAKPVSGRMCPRAGRNGSTLIDDTYNANPTAAKAALDFLEGVSGKRIFVLGDMLELGPEAPALHREIGEYAVGRCDELFAVGELAGEAAVGFGDNAHAFASIEAAVAELTTRLDSDVTLLVKASRSIGLEQIVRALEQDEGSGRC